MRFESSESIKMHLRPLGELTALPQTQWLDLGGKRGEEKGREGEGGEGREGIKPPNKNSGYGFDRSLS